MICLQCFTLLYAVSDVAKQECTKLQNFSTSTEPKSVCKTSFDNWGAEQYLENDEMKYVKDFLNRTEQLLESNTVKHISVACSYETVETFDDLVIDASKNENDLVIGALKDEGDLVVDASHSEDDLVMDIAKGKDYVVVDSSADEDVKVEKCIEACAVTQPEKLSEDLVHSFMSSNTSRVQECDTCELITHRSSNHVDQHPACEGSNNETNLLDGRKNGKLRTLGSFTDHTKIRTKNSFETKDHQSNKNCTTKDTLHYDDGTMNVELIASPFETDKYENKRLFEARKSMNSDNNMFFDSSINIPKYLTLTEESNSSNKQMQGHVENTKSSLPSDNHHVIVPRLELNDIHDDSTDCNLCEVRDSDGDEITIIRPQQLQSASTSEKNDLNFKVFQKKVDNSDKVSDEIKSKSGKMKSSKPLCRAGMLPENRKMNSKLQRKWEKSSIAWDSYGRKELSSWSSVQINNSKNVMNKQMRVNKFRKETNQLVTSDHNFKLHREFSSLPEEIIFHVFTFLPIKDLLIASQVCTNFRRIANDCQLWRSVNVTNITLTDQWFATMGKRRPASISIHHCNGSAISNVGLRSFFTNCKASLNKLRLEKCAGEELCGDSVLLHASCHCRNLRHVDVAWSKTTDNGIIAISVALPELHSLNVNGNSSITDEAFEILAQKHGEHLKSLELSGCFAVSSDVLLSLIMNTRSLYTLNIGLCNKITSECIVAMCSNLEHLQHLDVRGIKSLNNHCLHSIATLCKSLCTLIIANCSSVTDVGLAEISTYRPSIIHLDISGCSLVTDNGITSFIKSSISIKYLDVSSTGATHKTVDCLIENNCSKLQTLKLSFCHNITQISLSTLLNFASSLNSLHLYGCKRIKLAPLIKINKKVVIEK